MVLRTVRYDAMFAWRLARFRQDRQAGIECSIFRNEGSIRSSDLIREAQDLAWGRWPGERLFTYIDPEAVRSPNPGYCFKVCGWRTCGASRRGLLILERRPQ